MTCDTIFESEIKVDDKELIADFLIYPNPAKNFISIKCRNKIYNNLHIELFNLQGKCIISKRFPYTNDLILNVNNLNEDIYVCLQSKLDKLII
jgi:hypothetical protein